MNILSYKIAKTNELLTSRGGLVCLAELLRQTGFPSWVAQHFPEPGSNDVLGDWLRRLGRDAVGIKALVEVNRQVLAWTLGQCQEVTLDLDATPVLSTKREAKCTCLKARGYMPMLGPIGETGQVVGCDFRAGNVSPSSDNLGFIKACVAGLPEGVSVRHLRADSAGYQGAIFQYCDAHDMGYVIRARRSQALKRWLRARPESAWTPRVRDGEVVDGQDTCRGVWTITGYDPAFTLVTQRTRRCGQQSLDLGKDEAEDVATVTDGCYVYRALATNRDELSDSEIVHWYNQRAEGSENRIKELKSGFAGGRLPCGQFDANALYFHPCVTAYNLFVLLRHSLPCEWHTCRAPTMRWRVYALAAKLVCHARRVYLKFSPEHATLMKTLLAALAAPVRPPPLPNAPWSRCNVGAGTEADPINEQSVQARFTFQPTDRLSLDLRGRYLDGEAGGIYLVTISTPQIDDFSIPVSSNLNGEDEREVGSTSLKVDYIFDNGMTLTSISAYSETDSYFFGDGDFSTAALFAQWWEIDVEAFNQEVRLTSDDNNRLRWILGGFYQDREDKEFTEFGQEGPGLSVIPFPGGAREIRERQSWAVFSQLDYDLTEKLTLSAGARYDEEKNETEFGQLRTSPGETFDEWQPKVSLSYDWNENMMTYFTFARGFRPGGFSNTSGVLYENEVSDNFEIGAKASLLDSRIQLSAALFYIDFSDQQHFFSRVTPGGVQRFIINIAETTNRGAEVEIAVRALEGLDLNFGFGLTDTEIDDFDGTGLFNGNNTPQVNDFSFNASAQYTRPVTGPWQFTGRLDYEHRGEVDWDLNNLVTTPAKDYLNLYAEIGNEYWTLFFYGKNVLDEQQPTAMGTDVFGPGIHLRTPSRPASYGFGLKAHY